MSFSVQLDTCLSPAAATPSCRTWQQIVPVVLPSASTNYKHRIDKVSMHKAI